MASGADPVSALVWLLGLIVIYAIIFLRARDYYIIIREFRSGEPEFGIKGKTVEGRYLHRLHYSEGVL
jgi:hypothetical protein